MSPSAAEREFVRQRSKATSDHFVQFATERGLDLDADTWPDADRAEFDRRARELSAEWRARAEKLFGS
ncbi:hypothetical protein [Nocardia sienata]|uniref:hypothetical protein n=1 Tax=Nocardia sienata TaxID=248552 RepID=UPI0007A3A251|nr:hypothetical protein [Nocardia sienata]